MANIIGVNIYIDGVKHNSSPQPISATGYNISDVKDAGEQFEVQFSNQYDDGTESLLSAPQSYQLQNDGDIDLSEFTQTVNASQGAVTDTSFRVGAQMAESGAAKLVVYSNEARTNKVTESNGVETDFLNNCKFSVSGLNPDTKYYWAIESGGQKASMQGEIKTFPQGAASYKIVAGSCCRLNYPQFGFESVNDHHKDALLINHMGDIHYGDLTTTDRTQHNHWHNKVFEENPQQEIYLRTPLMYVFDDHDYGYNEHGGYGDKTMAGDQVIENFNSTTREAALEVYKSKYPHYPLISEDIHAPIGQTYVIGRVRYVVMDVRSQRIFGERVLGDAQKQWFKDTLLAATEKAICVLTIIPWISDVADGDTWGADLDEKAELMQFISDNNLNDRILMMAGDMHSIAIDDGTNNAGMPMYQFAAFASNTSYKGGPHSVGKRTEYYGQYGTLEIEDNGGDTIGIRGTGYGGMTTGYEKEHLCYTKFYGDNVDNAPTLPLDIRVKQISNTSIEITWDEAIRSDYYSIEKRKYSGEWETIVTNTNDLSYIDTISEEDFYSYRVISNAIGLTNKATAVSVIVKQGFDKNEYESRVIADGGEIIDATYLDDVADFINNNLVGCVSWLSCSLGVKKDSNGVLEKLYSTAGELFDVHQPNEGRRPQWESNGYNSLPEVQFTGQRYLIPINRVIMQVPVSYFLVASSGEGGDSITQSEVGGLLLDRKGSEFRVKNLTAPVNNNTNLHSIIYDGIDAQYHLNDTLESQDNIPEPDTQFEPIILGSSRFFLTTHSQEGSTSESIVIEGRTDAELTSINNFLNNRYNIY